MLTKNSPVIQNLLTRVKKTVPNITGPVEVVWEVSHGQHLGLGVTFLQDAPTKALRQSRPGYYSLTIRWIDSCPELNIPSTRSGWWAITDDINILPDDTSNWDIKWLLERTEDDPH